MIEREEEPHEYDYTKEIQQLKRVWKSYNNAAPEENTNKSPKLEKNDSKSKIKTNPVI